MLSKIRPYGFAAFFGFCAVLLTLRNVSSRTEQMTSTLLIGGSKIDVNIESGEMKLTHAELLRWVQSAAEAVATYYGRYPVSHVQIRIIPVDGSGVRHGQTFGYDGGLIKIRVGKQTRNTKGLQDALRGILEAGGDITHDWELAQALKIGDKATGTTVLSDLYAKWKDKPVEVDLTSMWKELGIAPDGKSVHLAEDAPLASVRRAITAPGMSKRANSERALPSAVFAGRSVATPRRA